MASSSSRTGVVGHISHSVFSHCLSESQVFESLPTAIVDLVSQYAQCIIKGEFLGSFSIDSAEHVVPYQYAGDDYANAVNHPETGFITREYRNIATFYTIYSITGEVMRTIKTPARKEGTIWVSLFSYQPEKDDNSCYSLFFNSDFGIVWSRHDNDFFDFTLFGETRKPFTHWINEKNHVIHEVGDGVDDGVGDFCDIHEYPLQLPSWVLRVSYDYVRIMGEILYLFCSVWQDRPPSQTSQKSPMSRLCMFTLKGQFVKFVLEVETDSIEDFIVTEDQQIFVLRGPKYAFYELDIWRSLPPSKSSGLLLYDTIYINACGFHGARLSLMKSGHLAVELKVNCVPETVVKIFQ